MLLLHRQLISRTLNNTNSISLRSILHKCVCVYYTAIQAAAKCNLLTSYCFRITMHLITLLRENHQYHLYPTVSLHTAIINMVMLICKSSFCFLFLFVYSPQ